MSHDSGTDRSHPVQIGYLVVGLVFLGIAGSWALRAADVVDTEQAGILVPLVLVGAGSIGLIAFVARGLSRRRRSGAVADGAPYPQAAYDEPWPGSEPTDDAEATDPTATYPTTDPTTTYPTTDSTTTYPTTDSTDPTTDPTEPTSRLEGDQR